MSTRPSEVFAYAVACVALGFAFAFLSMGTAGYARVPVCPEDAVLVGYGAFEDGRWRTYACGPAVDDFQQEDR